MKKILLLLSFGLLWIAAAAQKQDSSKTNKSSKKLGIGLKAGLNFSNVTNVSSINGSSQTGFHAGLFFGSFNKGLIGFRTELLYSQQGYGYSSGSAQGSVGLNYIFLAPMLAINVTRFVQIQAGFQTGYLLNAKADKSSGSTGNQTADKIIQFYNRFDYGFCGGLEIHPVGGLLIGARYNISLSNLYKMPSTSDSTGNPSYVPSASGINFKNNVVQVFVGYRF
ncbi:MAG TPA: porin family protein [Puia sp.]|nr:porin family protein [Puia sp.]